MSGSITAAHFHNAPAGLDGGVVHGITGDFDGGTAFGFWSMTAFKDPSAVGIVTSSGCMGKGENFFQEQGASQ